MARGAIRKHKSGVCSTSLSVDYLTDIFLQKPYQLAIQYISIAEIQFECRKIQEDRFECWLYFINRKQILEWRMPRIHNMVEDFTACTKNEWEEEGRWLKIAWNLTIQGEE